MTPTTADPAATAMASTTPAATPQYADNVSSDQALQDLTNFQTSVKSPVDVYNDAVTKLGIPDVRANVTSLRKNIADTNALLSALPDSVSGRTSGSLTTEAQRQRVLATERAPLDTANAGYSNNYNMESANLNDLTGQASNQAQLVDAGNKNIQDALTTRLTTIQSKEQTAAAKAEADRQFQATLDSIKQSQAQFAATLAENQRQFNISSAASKASANAPSVPQQASSDAGRLLNGIMTRPPGYTEATIIPTLQSQYPELTDAQIKSIVYSNRKSQFGF